MSRPYCQYCSEREATRVLSYPLFMFICTPCFFEYAKTHDELEYQTIEGYERSLQ